MTMEDTPSIASSLPGSPAPESWPLTVSPSATSLEPSDENPEKLDGDSKSEDKKPTKKRKSWGQELPTPKTNLPPRKRAKTDDEKEQRRIERVLRNRAAAQTSRERKRLEMEKLEGEKVIIEQQNQSLLERLTRMETENNRLNKQVAQLTAEIRGNTPNRGSSPLSDSPTLTSTLFKQEVDEPALERISLPTPPVSDNSPTLEPSSLAESSDMAQHPAVPVDGLEGEGSALSAFGDFGSGAAEPLTPNDIAVPISDDDFRRLFDSGPIIKPDPSFLEDGFVFDVLEGGDLSAFPFDSLVNFDPESIHLEGIEPSHGLPDEASHQTSSLQPSLGASPTRCDGQSLAASRS